MNVNAKLVELSQSEIEDVSGGVIFVPALYAAFVSGAKWGAAMTIAVYAIQQKYK